MKKKTQDEMTDELRPEYDMRELLRTGVRGKYAKRYKAGTNLVLLEPDVAWVFVPGHLIREPSLGCRLHARKGLGNYWENGSRRL